MIVVDSSVWIDHFRDRDTAQVRLLRSIRPALAILVGDLVMVEVLQGARDDAHAARLERELRSFRLVPLTDLDLARQAAWNYRKLRGLGFTVRRTIDLIIGTFCIERGFSLLHCDRDFDAMVTHLGLQTA